MNDSSRALFGILGSAAVLVGGVAFTPIPSTSKYPILTASLEIGQLSSFCPSGMSKIAEPGYYEKYKPEAMKELDLPNSAWGRYRYWEKYQLRSWAMWWDIYANGKSVDFCNQFPYYY